MQALPSADPLNPGGQRLDGTGRGYYWIWKQMLCPFQLLHRQASYNMYGALELTRHLKFHPLQCIPPLWEGSKEFYSWDNRSGRLPSFPKWLKQEKAKLDLQPGFIATWRLVYWLLAKRIKSDTKKPHGTILMPLFSEDLTQHMHLWTSHLSSVYKWQSHRLLYWCL